MRLLAGVLLTGWCVAGCASAPPLASDSPLAPSTPEQDYGFNRDGFVWVRGPWTAIEPSRDMDDVIDQLCPAVMSLPRATLKEYGQEYCGAIYTLGEGTYYASKPSPLGKYEGNGPTHRKNCYPPRYVIDQRGHAVTHLDYHGHPWLASGLSARDREARSQFWPLRIQFDTRCTIQKLIPNLDSTRPGEVYERRGKTWVLIGLITPEDKPSGRLTPVTTP
jgi:hypothetical protein